jgi:hypothetical protein
VTERGEPEVPGMNGGPDVMLERLR